MYPGLSPYNTQAYRSYPSPYPKWNLDKSVVKPVPTTPLPIVSEETTANLLETLDHMASPLPVCPIIRA